MVTAAESQVETVCVWAASLLEGRGWRRCRGGWWR